MLCYIKGTIIFISSCVNIYLSLLRFKEILPSILLPYSPCSDVYGKEGYMTVDILPKTVNYSGTLLQCV